MNTGGPVVKTPDEFRSYLKERIWSLIDQAMKDACTLDPAQCHLTIAAVFMKTGLGFVVRGDIAREQLAQAFDIVAAELRKSML